LRWSEFAGYAQDQWTMTPKLTVNYGVRYEYYPPPYRDHTGVYILDPTLPQSGNVEVGGVGGNPEDAGLDMGKGFFAPRLGLAYRVNERMVLRTGGGMTSDPDSLRFLRDTFPEDISPTYSGTASDTIAVDPGNNNAPMTLTYGIPPPVFPTYSSGFASLGVSGSDNTAPKNYRRGYIESWNVFVQQDLGHDFVFNLGYVGTHQVRQLVGYTLDAAPLPSASTTCMANGQYNPTSGYAVNALGHNPCSFQANTVINQMHCMGAASPVCYNTGGITYNAPSMSSSYNGMQAQLTRNAGKRGSIGAIYTWSHAFDFEDNGAGSGSAGTADSYPAYFHLDRATASYDRPNNIQIWGIYQLPFGRGQLLAHQGIASAIFGGFQLNGQYSQTSGAPFSVNPSSSAINSPGNTEYAELVAPYHQLGGHNRTPGNTSVSGGKPWFDPTVFANPTEPKYSATESPAQIVGPVFSNTHRDEFRGPRDTVVNASVFRAFRVFREGTEFQVRFEAFNLLNHPQPTPGTSDPNATVGGGTFGYITSFGSTRSLQFSGRFNF
jgi:hypothetical protein